MGVVTVRPNSTVQGGHTLVDSTYHGALSDDNDATYVQTGNTTSPFIVGFPNPSIPAGAVVKDIRYRHRRNYASGSLQRPNARIILTRSNGSVEIRADWELVGQSNPATVASPWTPLSVEPTGLRIAYRRGTGSGSISEIRCRELYIDTQYVAKPDLTVTAPTGTLTTTNRPTVEWTPDLDSDGGAQSHFVVKIFTNAQVTGGGFNPDTAPPVQQSGFTSGDDIEWQPDDGLDDDDYHAYVTIWQSVNGELHKSDWDSSAFTIDVDRPGEPSLTLTSQSDDGRIRIDADPSNKLPGANIASSFEADLAGWSDTGNPPTSRTRVDEESKHGDWSQRVITPGNAAGEGARTDSVDVSASQTHHVSAWVMGDSGATLEIAINERDSGDANIGFTVETFEATGEWQRVEVERAFGGTGVKARLIVRATGTLATTFYIDRAVMVEGPTASTDWIELETSNDGSDWGDLRTVDGDAQIDDATIAYDFEAQNGVLRHIRARAVKDHGGGLVVASNWVSGTATWTKQNAVWLKHAVLPQLNTAVRVRSFDAQERDTGATVHKVLGRSDPVVTRDPARISESGELVLRSDNAAERAKLDALLDTSDPLLLQFHTSDDEPDRWIAHVGPHSRERIVPKAFAKERWETVPWQRVKRPTHNIVEWPED